MKDLTARDIKLIQDNLTVSKNLLELSARGVNVVGLTDPQAQAVRRIYDLLIDAEAIIFTYFGSALDEFEADERRAMSTKDIKLFAECPNCGTRIELHDGYFWASTGDGTMSHPAWGKVTLNFECSGCDRSFETVVREW